MTDGDEGDWTELRDEAETLERHVTTQKWAVPVEVHVEADVLIGRSDWGPGVRWASSAPAMLEEFLRLADASPAEMAAYVEQWGFLDLCTHYLPISHATGHDPIAVPFCLAAPTAIFEFGPTTRCWQLVGREPVAAWRYWSGQARALLDIAARLRDRTKGNPSDWRRLAERAHWAPDPDPDDQTMANVVSGFTDLLVSGKASVGAQQNWVGAVIDWWLRVAGVRFGVEWSRSARPVLEFQTGGLFGALGIQIALAAASIPVLTLCAACGLPHQPSRLPSPAGRSYCLSCRGTNVPGRDAQRRSREKRKVEDPGYLPREAERKREERRRAKEYR